MTHVYGHVEVVELELVSHLAERLKRVLLLGLGEAVRFLRLVARLSTHTYTHPCTPNLEVIHIKCKFNSTCTVYVNVMLHYTCTTVPTCTYCMCDATHEYTVIHEAHKIAFTRVTMFYVHVSG